MSQLPMSTGQRVSCCLPPQASVFPACSIACSIALDHGSRGRWQAVPTSAPQAVCRGSCLFKKKLLIFIYVYVCICRGEYLTCLGAHGDSKRVPDPLELDL